MLWFLIENCRSYPLSKDKRASGFTDLCLPKEVLFSLYAKIVLQKKRIASSCASEKYVKCL